MTRLRQAGQALSADVQHEVDAAGALLGLVAGLGEELGQVGRLLHQGCLVGVEEEGVQQSGGAGTQGFNPLFLRRRLAGFQEGQGLGRLRQPAGREGLEGLSLDFRVGQGTGPVQQQPGLAVVEGVAMSALEAVQQVLCGCRRRDLANQAQGMTEYHGIRVADAGLEGLEALRVQQSGQLVGAFVGLLWLGAALQ